MLRWLQTSLFGSVPADDTAPSSQASDARWQDACGDLNVALVPAPRLRHGWRLEWRRGPSGPAGAQLRVPAAFTAPDTPDEILRALAGWVRLVLTVRGKTKAAAARPARLALEKTLHAWLDAHTAGDARARRLARGRSARKLDRLKTQGRHHDLQAIFDAVNAEYFGGTLRARITWSSRWGGLSTQSTARDAEGNPYALLTISRGYDHPSATPEIVGGVVYHECLHVAVPPEEKNGRRVVHGREFRRREKQYRYYEEWRRWHAEKLPGIIRRGR